MRKRKKTKSNKLNISNSTRNEKKKLRNGIAVLEPNEAKTKNRLDYLVENSTGVSIVAGFIALSNNWIHDFVEIYNYTKQVDFDTPHLYLSLLKGIYIFGITSTTAKIILDTFSPFSIPRGESISKIKKLEREIIQNYNLLLKNGDLNSKYDELYSCYDKKEQYYLKKADIEFSCERYDEGLSNFLSYLRLHPQQKRKNIFNPIRLLIQQIPFTLETYGFALEKIIHPIKSSTKKKRKLYSLLCKSLVVRESDSIAEELSEVIRDNYDTLDDKFSYANIMTYLGKPSEKSWKPFFDMLEMELKQKNKTIDSIVDKSADTRNKVIRYKNIFLKKFNNAMDLDSELNNLNHFSELNHVVAKALPAKITGDNYLLTLFSGDTLFDVMNSLTTIEKENALGKSVEQLYEIHIYGMNGLTNENVSAKHYTDRVKALTSSILCEDEVFFNYYDNTISNHIGNLNGLYYKDNNLRNILYEEGLIREIDFEKNLLKHPTLDLVSTLEFGPFSSEKFNESMVRLYRKLLGEQFNESDDDFIRNFQYSRVQRHMEFMGYRLRGDADKTKAQFHLSTAINALERISSFNHNPDIPCMIQFLERSSNKL